MTALELQTISGLSQFNVNVLPKVFLTERSAPLSGYP